MTTPERGRETSWQPIDTCPKVVAKHQFRWEDGSEKIGTHAPFWCGSDCPCYPLDEGPSEFLTEYPDCWGVEGHEIDPVEWRPLPDAALGAGQAEGEG